MLDRPDNQDDPYADLTFDEKIERIENLRSALAQKSLLDFTSYTFPDYEVSWHHRVIAETLDQVLDYKLRRVMFLVPPQNGKSELVSRRFPAYTLGKFPNKKIIACSYNADLAADMSRDVQKIMDSERYRRTFPLTRLAQKRGEDVRTQQAFGVVDHKGAYHSAGIGGGITGKTADIGIIDDPVKNREEAESKTYRDYVWNWYVSAFLSRQYGSVGAIVIAMTDWHEDSLAGRLLKLAKENPEAEQWHVVKLEAIAENPNGLYDHRAIGEALWPSKYPLAELKRRRIVMGEYEWQSLYMQNPVPPGGVMFKREWFADRFVDAAPVIARRVRGWDTAGTPGAGDYTAGVKISEELRKKPDGSYEGTGIFFVEDVQHVQLGPGDVDALMRAMAELDGVECSVREEKEPGSSGLAVVEARSKSLKGYDYRHVIITGDKVNRARPFRAQCEAGNVRIVRGAFNEKYVSELCSFPTGTHDDQVDASSCAFNAVLLEPLPRSNALEGALTW